MSTDVERSPRPPEAITLADDGDLEPSAAITSDLPAQTSERPLDHPTAHTTTLAELPPGARLVLRCRKDWRAASVASVEDDCVRLNVASPSGHAYRVRRPHDAPLTFDGSIPVLSDRDSAEWRVGLARYDARW